MNISRIEYLEQQASIEPLVWTPKRGGEALIGIFVDYDHGVWFIRDAYGVVHRTALNALGIGQWLQWNEYKRITHDDLISIQFLGVERDEYGKKNPVYNFVIDRGL